MKGKIPGQGEGEKKRRGQIKGRQHQEKTSLQTNLMLIQVFHVWSQILVELWLLD